MAEPPFFGNERKQGESAPLFEIRGLSKTYPVRGGAFGFGRKAELHAVDGVSFDIGRGETLGLVGESGCGKSTLARMAAALIAPSGGEIRLKGEPVKTANRFNLHKFRRQVQLVFQDPVTALNARMRVGDIVAEPLKNFELHRGTALREAVAALFERVGLRPDQMARYPHEFSGGQKQRIGIARALALRPELIICDEPVSALDVSVQAQVINLLMDLQAEFGLSYLFVAHDLAVIRHISQRVAVMYLGRLVEIGGKRDIFSAPAHPYTRMLLAAVPKPDPRQKRVRLASESEMPSPIDLPPGCRFQSRCPAASDRCRSTSPELTEIRPGHAVACHHPVAA